MSRLWVLLSGKFVEKSSHILFKRINDGIPVMVINFGWVSIMLKNDVNISPLVTCTAAYLYSLCSPGSQNIVSCSITGRFSVSNSRTGSNTVCGYYCYCGHFLAVFNYFIHEDIEK